MFKFLLPPLFSLTLSTPRTFCCVVTHCHSRTVITQAHSPVGGCPRPHSGGWVSREATIQKLSVHLKTRHHDTRFIYGTARPYGRSLMPVQFQYVQLKQYWLHCTWRVEQWLSAASRGSIEPQTSSRTLGFFQTRSRLLR